MGKSSPAAPDPAATAAAQGAANEAAARTTAKLNNPNTYGPGGAVEHEWGPNDTSSVYTYLSPGQQDIYDRQQDLTQRTTTAAQEAAGRMQGLLSSGVDTSGLQDWATGPSAAPALRTSIGGAGEGIQSSIAGAGQGIQTGFAGATQGTEDYGAQRDEVTNAIMSRVQGQYDQDRTSLDAKLASQGFTVGSQGYRDSADEANRSLTDARMQAVLAGGQEQSRLFGLDQSRLGFNNSATNTQLGLMNQAQAQAFAQNAQNAQFGNDAQAQGFGQRATDAGFGNTAMGQQFNMDLGQAANANQTRQAQLAERLQLRAQPVNETAALFGLGTGVQMPQQAQVSGVQVGSPDYQGLVNSNYKSAAAASAQNNAATTGAAVGVASAAAVAI